MEWLVVQFLNSNLEEAERAAMALTSRWRASRIAEVAQAWHKKGNRERANRIYQQALKAASENVQALAQVTEEAAQFGYIEDLAGTICANVNKLLLEEQETLDRWTQSGLRNGRAWLINGSLSNHEFYGLLARSPKPPHPNWENKIKGLALRMRLLRRNHSAKKERLFQSAFEQWLALSNQPWEQIQELPHLARAAGPERAPHLMPRIMELVAHTRQARQGRTAGKWHKSLSWSLAFLEEWSLSLDLACETAEPKERIEALQLWIAISPLNQWEGQLERIVQEKPVYGWILGRLGQYNRRFKKKARAFIDTTCDS